MSPDAGNGARGSGGKSSAGPAVLAVGLLLLMGIGVAVYVSRDGPQPQPEPQPEPQPKLAVVEDGGSAELLAHGLDLHAQHCAACHGEQGGGNGSAAYLLSPKPRDFSNGTLLLTSTEIGLPSDKDLLKTLRDGMPGSSMPPWEHLGDDDLDALVQAIRHLALEGKVAELTADEGLSREEALEIAHEIVDSGPEIDIPAKPADIDMALGKKIYVETCAKCHDEDGRGRLREDMVDEYGYPSFARDFTLGIFKGGSDDEALVARLVRGLPGSPMPGAEYTPKELWSVVAYVQEMIDPEAQAKVQQRQQTLTAERAEGSLPSDPTDAGWNDVSETYLPVMPLWWRNDRIEGVTVQAVHDGSKLAVRLRWDDATEDDHAQSSTSFGDGAALQFSDAADAPLFAMGAKDVLVKVWYWRAMHQRTIKDGRTTLKDVHPNMPHTDEDAYPGIPREETFTTALSADNPVSELKPATSVENLHARGFGTLTTQGPDAQDIAGAANRQENTWQVVFVRDLAPGLPGDITFEPGSTVNLAFAVWDGTVGDRNGQKSVTIWHRLKLQP